MIRCCDDWSFVLLTMIIKTICHDPVESKVNPYYVAGDIGALGIWDEQDACLATQLLEGTGRIISGIA
jgi:hypothetical protein